jgi:hypothetical protein
VKTLLLVSALGALCVLGLFALKDSANVSVQVVSCDSDGREAIVRVAYRNRLPRSVKISYDLVLTVSGMASRGGSNGQRVIKVQHIDSVSVAESSEEERVIKIAFPPKVVAASAVTLNMSYK